MKRILIWLVLGIVVLGWAGPASNAFAQNAAADAAAREAAEDNLKRLVAAVEKLDANQTAQQQRIEALEKGFQDLREAIIKAGNQSATQESLRRLGEHIQKVDEARVTENKKIQETLDELYRVIKTAAAAPPPPRTPVAPVPPRPATTNAGTEEGFEYKVEPGDMLPKIVQKYRAEGVKLTQKMVMDANPNIKWDRLRVGQKIFIPKPKN